jgi:hypothetical protein
MDFASSRISVEKNKVGPGVAGVQKKLDRCGGKHEIEALILTCIRASARKRRKQASWSASSLEIIWIGTPTPGSFARRVRKRKKRKELNFA